MNDLISRKALIAEYDRVHIGPTGGARKLIEDAPAVREWIPVSERLPTREDANETGSILAINKDEKYVGRWIWDIVVRWPTEFTYWMPLPEPPKEG